MHIGTIRRPQFVFGVVFFVAFASFSATRAVTISNGMYIGSNGLNSSGSPINMGGVGGDGYDFGDETNQVTGGTLVGGKGGNASGGELAEGGQGGAGAKIATGTLTITGGSFQGGAGGVASGASESNESGVPGYALVVYNSSPTTTTLIYGGTFQGNFDFLNYATIKLYGTFNGGPRTITGQQDGTFSGLLGDNTTPATYSYFNEGGEIILEPEPTACAALIAPALMLMRRRKI